jgi:hypothetical protein
MVHAEHNFRSGETIRDRQSFANRVFRSICAIESKKFLAIGCVTPDCDNSGCHPRMTRSRVRDRAQIGAKPTGIGLKV